MAGWTRLAALIATHNMPLPSKTKKITLNPPPSKYSSLHLPNLSGRCLQRLWRNVSRIWLNNHNGNNHYDGINQNLCKEEATNYFRCHLKNAMDRHTNTDFIEHHWTGSGWCSLQMSNGTGHLNLRKLTKAKYNQCMATGEKSYTPAGNAQGLSKLLVYIGSRKSWIVSCKYGTTV